MGSGNFVRAFVCGVRDPSVFRVRQSIGPLPQGGKASASSNAGTGFSPQAFNDSDRAGKTWGEGEAVFAI